MLSSIWKQQYQSRRYHLLAAAESSSRLKGQLAKPPLVGHDALSFVLQAEEQPE
jgi:hypothetical protein